MDADKIINRLASRRFKEDLAANLAEVAAALEKAGKGSKGKVSLTIDLENAGDLQIATNETFKLTFPPKPSRGALFYSFNGKLFDRDPRETPLVYRDVDTETGEIREPQMQPAPVREV